MNETGSHFCPDVGFVIGGVERLDRTTRKFSYYRTPQSTVCLEKLIIVHLVD
jgi:hypothetical protein